MKAKFRELCFGPSSGEETRDEWEKRVDEASGVMTSFDKSINNENKGREERNKDEI